MGGLLAGVGYGTTLFWVLVSAAFVIFVAVIVFWIRYGRAKRLLREPVLKIQQDAPYADSQLEKIEQILADTGYAYDWQQNIYYSVMNPWQRKMGYCRLYDEWAAPLGMVFDCEPVCFNYNGKRWLIEFWKGQYGITVGGEIGVYNTAEPDLNIPGVFKGTFYHSANDNETLGMAFTLHRNHKVLFNREGRHWWLTGFVLGEYSDPSALTMDASVTLRDQQMRDAFLEALGKLGYRDDDIMYDGNAVQFTFAKPHSKQPLMRRGPFIFLTMIRTRFLVAQYKEITKGQTNMYDILMTLKEQAPLLYHLVLNTGRRKELFRSFDDIGKYLT